jgi:hypothetical protein
MAVQNIGMKSDLSKWQVKQAKSEPRLDMERSKRIHCSYVAIIILVACASWHFSGLFSKMKASMVTLALSKEVYETKSNSLKHDARIATIFRSNIYIFKECRNSFGGEVMLSFLKTSKMLRNIFDGVESKYINQRDDQY